MAVNATHAVRSVLGIECVHVLRAAGVAGQAASVEILGRKLREPDDFRGIAASLDVGLARSVTPLATLMRRATAGIQRGLPVRRLFPVLVDILVAGLANLRADVAGRLGIASR